MSTVNWWPFDTGIFTSSSYDNTFKLWDTETLEAVLTLDLKSKIYAHHISPIAQHLLVACKSRIQLTESDCLGATESPFVRLCDPKSGAMAQNLIGHGERASTVQWSPALEFILATGSIDGEIRIWDIRRASSSLFSLQSGMVIQDFSNSTGMKAHFNGVNGLAWSGDGLSLISAGRDDQLRVWDMRTCIDRLVHFGPYIQNQHFQQVNPILFDINSKETAIAFPNDDGSLVIFEMNGSLANKFKISKARVTSVAVSSNSMVTENAASVCVSNGLRNYFAEVLRRDSLMLRLVYSRRKQLT